MHKWGQRVVKWDIQQSQVIDVIYFAYLYNNELLCVSLGHVGWGISWYINGLLIPEINVVRGKTYTFVVEGGNDPDTPAKYHPFYITDDPVGGFEYKTEDEREVKI
jgi:hypothetical protein